VFLLLYPPAHYPSKRIIVDSCPTGGGNGYALRVAGHFYLPEIIYAKGIDNTVCLFYNSIVGKGG
jgi:hypothetical protein